MLAGKFLKIEKFRKSAYYSQNPKNFRRNIFGTKNIYHAHYEEKYGRKLVYYDDNSNQKYGQNPPNIALVKHNVLLIWFLTKIF